MTLKINRYSVRYQGKLYGPGKEGGQILEGLSEEEEALLIADSRGTIERIGSPIEAPAEAIPQLEDENPEDNAELEHVDETDGDADPGNEDAKDDLKAEDIANLSIDDLTNAEAEGKAPAKATKPTSKAPKRGR